MPDSSRHLVASLAVVLGVAMTAVAVLGTAFEWGEEATRRPLEGEPDASGGAGETPEQFLAALASAIREGDADFQLERLHPEVLERYGEDACRAAIDTRTDPTRAFAVTQVRDDPEPFDYTSDGRTETIAATVVVEARVTTSGTTAPQDVHLARVDGELRYFSDCGTPLPS